MKWYEKQKQLYEEKLKSEDSTESKETTASKETTNSKDLEPFEERKEEQIVENDNESKVDELLQASGYDHHESSYSTRKEEEPRKVTTIQSKTTFQGNIETEDDIVVYGTLVGDINCDGDIIVYGNIQGNVMCHNATFKEARVEGDIDCSGSLTLTEKSILYGNTKVINLENGGQIKGDVVVEETAHFLTTSAIIGNITALEIQVDRGCIIQGSITISEKIDF